LVVLVGRAGGPARLGARQSSGGAVGSASRRIHPIPLRAHAHAQDGGHVRVKRVLATVLLAATIPAMAATAACTRRTSDDRRRILRVAYDREIDVLNPFTSQNLVDISFSMIEGLITTDDRDRYIPVLAKLIPTEDNGLIVHRDDGKIEMTWPLVENV